MRVRWLFLVLFPLALGALPLALPAGRNLEYEYALLVSILSILLLPYASLLQEKMPTGRRERFLHLFWLFAAGPLLVLVPGMLMFLLRWCPCSTEEFRFWMLVQWYPSWILGGGLAQVLWRVRGTYRLSRLRAAAVYACILVLFIISLAATLWFLPQKRVTHFLVGFIHGPIYDEWIPINDGILWQRLAHVFLGTTLIALAWWRRRALQTSALILSLLLFVGFTHKASEFPSVQNGKRYLNRLMPYEIKTADFTIHYAAPDATLPPEIEQLYYDSVFHVQELKRTLKIASQHVDIYIYPDRQSMKLWFGGEQTDITDVFTPSIHITAGEYPHETLRHELVHALAAEFGFYGIGFHPNMAFTEGLAVALAPPEMRIGLDEGAAALINSKKVRDVAQLFSPLFWQESGARSYTVAGSIVKYLLKNHGIDKIRALYAGENWDTVFGEDRISILRSWQDSLASLSTDHSRDLQVASLFRNPGILYDRCPHTKAVRRRDDNDDTWLKVRRPQEWKAKKDYWPWRLQLDPNDASARNMTWQHRMKDAYHQKQWVQLEEGASQLEKEINWPPKELEDVELQLLLSDVEYFTQKRAASAERLTRLIDFAQTKSIGDDLLRQAYVRQVLAAEVAEPQTLRWRAYIAGWESMPPATAQAQPWILTYLHLRRGERSLRSLPVLERLLTQPVPAGLPGTFAVEWYKFLGMYLQEARDFTKAATAYQQAATHASSGVKAVFEEHARRMEFFQANPQTPPKVERL